MRSTGAKLRKLRRMAKCSLDRTCRIAGNIDISRLSKFERGLLPMRPDQIESVERTLRNEIAAESRRLAQVVAQWPQQPDVAVGA